MRNNDSLCGWIPLYVKNARAEVEWAYMGVERFTEPFCHETLQRLATRPFNQLFRRQSELGLLVERAKSHPGLPLHGLIFHMSRCGSTLAAQWLAALPDSVVLSEPEPADTLLQWPPHTGDEDLLRGLFAALGQPRRECDRRLFIKTDCSHLLQIGRYLAAFPGTPWIFMYRDPIEVLVSHQRSMGMFQISHILAAAGIQSPAEAWRDPLSNTAWTLSLILENAAHAMGQFENGLLINYSELPETPGAIARHFGIADSDFDTQAVAAVNGCHSKWRTSFEPDSEEKRSAADSQVRELSERWLSAPYQQLERLRLEHPKLHPTRA